MKTTFLKKRRASLKQKTKEKKQREIEIFFKKKNLFREQHAISFLYSFCPVIIRKRRKNAKHGQGYSRLQVKAC
jgi:hypothetical protein